jgi:hypothetical protein
MDINVVQLEFKQKFLQTWQNFVVLLQVFLAKNGILDVFVIILGICMYLYACVHVPVRIRDTSRAKFIYYSMNMYVKCTCMPVYLYVQAQKLKYIYYHKKLRKTAKKHLEYFLNFCQVLKFYRTFS